MSLGVLGERMPLAEIAKDAKDNREDTLRDQNPWRLGKMKGIEAVASGLVPDAKGLTGN